MQRRTDFTHLPASAEIRRLRSSAAAREIPEGNRHRHFPDFQPAVELLAALTIPAEFLRQGRPGADRVAGILAEAESAIDAAIGKLCDPEKRARTGLAADPSPLDRAYGYLAEEDPARPSDLIFVFGAKTGARAVKAAELFHQGIADRVLVSGDRPVYDRRGRSEAEVYRECLIAAGVPASRILVEAESRSMIDNVRRSLNLLDALGQRFGSLTLVNSPYSQRRGWTHFRKFLPSSVALDRVNATTRGEFSREGWHRSEVGVRVVLGEFVRMKIATALGTA